MQEERHLGFGGPDEIERMLQAASAMADISARIDFISRHFLGVRYRESTLIGSPDIPEVLVINLQAVDCFTYLDYVESMRFSHSFEEFRHHLRMVRYRSGRVSYGERNHFFTDWAASSRVYDVTDRIGREKARGVTKILNRKGDGTCFLPTIPPVKRKIVFVPTSVIDEQMFATLETGDYVGIYTETDGLDVSHVGIAVRGERRVLLRHASSIGKKVIDQDLKRYVSGKPGIIVLRPRSE
ncbi:MAG: N-acetylmuramoyl-L-alanine amidase-like domain-containing protein [Syntrophorhabdales bacterium]|jgi:hypothetical protein